MRGNSGGACTHTHTTLHYTTLHYILPVWEIEQLQSSLCHLRLDLHHAGVEGVLLGLICVEERERECVCVYVKREGKVEEFVCKVGAWQGAYKRMHSLRVTAHHIPMHTHSLSHSLISLTHLGYKTALAAPHARAACCWLSHST
jgi:hypothetical protein